MTTLEQLNQGASTAKLSDLSEAEYEFYPTNLNLSNITTAAKVASLSSDATQVEGVYSQVSNEMEEQIGRSPTSDSIIAETSAGFANASNQALIDILTNPNLSDQDKAAAASAVVNQRTQGASLNQMVSLSSLNRESGDLGAMESPEAEYVRVSLVEAIDSVDQWRSQSQAMLNEQLIQSYPTMSSAFVDVAEYLIPFVEQAGVGEFTSRLREGDPSAFSEAFTLLGSLKGSLRDQLKSMPIEDRMDFATKVFNLVNNPEVVIFTTENDFAKMDFLKTVLEDGYYTDTDKFIDNVVSVLDLVAPVIPLAGPAASTAARMVRRVVNNRRTRVAPTSLSQIVKDANPEQARGLFAATVSSEGDEVAQAAYGTTRTDAVANDMLPEIDVGDSVRNKVNDIDRIVRAANATQAEIFDRVRNTGFTQLTPAEKSKLRDMVRLDFEQAQGITPRKEMFGISYIESSDGMRISGVYGPSNSGFSSAREALETVKVAFRKYGIDDKHLTLLRRSGGEYEPVPLNQVLAEEALTNATVDMLFRGRLEGQMAVDTAADLESEMFKIGARARLELPPASDFLVKVDFDYKINPIGLSVFDFTDVKRNIFDRLGIGLGDKRGSFTRNLVDPSSMFARVITSPMGAAVERSAGIEAELLELGKGFTDKVTKLDVDRQSAVMNYVQEANYKGLDFNINNLKASGFDNEQIAALQSFRDFWDTEFVLSNWDLAKTLRAQGWEEFVDAANDVKLTVRAVSPLRKPKIARVYDPATGNFVDLSRTQIDELYDNGGTLAMLRDKIEDGDDYVDMIAIPNKQNGGYIRAFNEDSQVLTYRPGYYRVTYSDPVFIERVFKKRDGSLEVRAVATAGSVSDAKTMVDRLSRTDGSEAVSFRYRPDTKGRTKAEIFEDELSLSTARGFSSQRVRGKRLMGSTSNVDDLANAPILDPVDTIIGAVRSTAQRAAMRDVLDTYAARILHQYGDYLPRDPVTGRKYIPGSQADIFYRGEKQLNKKELGEVRSHFEYLKSLQDGYINDIDDFWKRSLKEISMFAGEKGLSKTEGALRWMSETRGPVAFSRNFAFQAYLATNPLRQFIIQSHQATQLAANFPKWFARAPGQFTALVAMVLDAPVNKAVLKAAGWTPEQAKAVYKAWERSGLSAGVDKNNLIRGSLTDMADRAAGKGFTAMHWLRVVGFDAGETASRLTSFLAHADDAIRKGKDISKLDVQEEVSGLAINYIYNMNKAGAMPYNENALGAIFQFMQVPHKAMLMMTNRQLSRKERARLLGFNAFMYGVPSSLAYSLFANILPEDHSTTVAGVSVRDFMVSGAQGAMMNKMLSLAVGEETYINWEGLAPNDQYGLFEFIHSLATMGPGEALANSPSGQLLFGGDSRVAQFARTAARYGNFFEEDFAGESGPTELVDVIHSFMSISSGYSNTFRARMAMEEAKIRNRAGDITDSNVSSAEAWATVFGFQTQDATRSYWLTQEMYTKKEDLRKDVEAYYKDLKRHLLREGITSDEFEFVQKTLSTAWLAFGNNNYVAKDMLDSLMQADFNNGDARLYHRVLDMQGFVSRQEMMNMLNNIPDIDQETKQQMVRAMDAIYDYQDEM